MSKGLEKNWMHRVHKANIVEQDIGGNTNIIVVVNVNLLTIGALR